MEISNESNKDSISIEKNSKGFNYTVKCYINGSNDLEDTEEKLVARLKRLATELETTYGNKAPF